MKRSNRQVLKSMLFLLLVLTTAIGLGAAKAVEPAATPGSGMH